MAPASPPRDADPVRGREGGEGGLASSFPPQRRADPRRGDGGAHSRRQAALCSVSSQGPWPGCPWSRGSPSLGPGPHLPVDPTASSLTPGFQFLRKPCCFYLPMRARVRPLLSPSRPHPGASCHQCSLDCHTDTFLSSRCHLAPECEPLTAGCSSAPQRRSPTCSVPLTPSCPHTPVLTPRDSAAAPLALVRLRTPTGPPSLQASAPPSPRPPSGEAALLGEACWTVSGTSWHPCPPHLAGRHFRS